jgi:hypothetical protein
MLSVLDDIYFVFVRGSRNNQHSVQDGIFFIKFKFHHCSTSSFLNSSAKHLDVTAFFKNKKIKKIVGAPFLL